MEAGTATPPKHAIIDDLAAIVGVDAVLHDSDELAVYACDGFPVARGLPTAVVFPTTTPQVRDCVLAAIRRDLPIIPRGSGTGLAGGATAYGEGLIICTSRMTRIESIDASNRVAVAGPGVRNVALSEAVAATPGAQHLHFSPDPSSQRASTIGGNAATNAGGINTLKHGVTTNHILGVEIVTGTGDILTTGGALYDRVGPDLPGLICGSEGTLGIITKLWCRLVPRPASFRTVYAVFTSTQDCCHTVRDTIAAGIIPTSMEVMDGAMIRVVEDAFAYGFPTDAAALLLIEIDGVEAALDAQMAQIVGIARDNHAMDVQQCADPKRRAELWSARKRAFGAIGRISNAYCTQDACVPRSLLPQVMARVAELGQEYGVQITNVFHAGDGNIHPILLFDEDDPDQVQNVLRLSEAILAYCIDVGGSLTGEHGVGVEKIHLMARMFGPDTLDTFSRIKDTLDPQARFNDGKLIPSPRVSIELLKPVAANSPGGAS